MAIFLIIVGLLLIIVNSFALKKESSSFGTSLSKAENDITAEDIKIGELRKEFAETIMEIQLELEEIKKCKKVSEISENVSDFSVKNEGNKYKEIEYNKKVIIDESLNKDNFIDKRSNNIKIDEIKKLVEDDFSDEEIAKKLSVGKGEVLLIKELYLK